MVAVVEQVLIALVLRVQLVGDAVDAVPHRVINPVGQPSTRRVGFRRAGPVVHQVQAAAGIGEERPDDADMPPGPSLPDPFFALVDLLRGEQVRFSWRWRQGENPTLGSRAKTSGCPL